MTDAPRDDYTRAWERDRRARRIARDPNRERELERERDRRKRLKRGMVPRPPSPSKAERQAARQAEVDALPFVACDGEGYRDQATGRDQYALLRIGDRELFDGGRRLTTPECLAFILAHPSPDDILVAFSFGYDASNILFDVPRQRSPESPDARSRFERLMLEGGNAWTWLNFPGHPQYGVHYRPGNHLRVCLAEHYWDRKKERWALHAKPGSIRMIQDVWGDFQSTFLGALDKWEIGSAVVREEIRRMKDQRRDFVGITPEIRDYCRIECELLVDLMTAFRGVALDFGIRPKTWNGAGKLAVALLDEHKETRRKEIESRKRAIPEAVLKMATHAYYGGRFECSRIGWVGGRHAIDGGPVWEHDLNSAYPAAMLKLPCLRHGRFRRAEAEELQFLLEASRLGGPQAHPLFLCPVHFDHAPLVEAPSTFFCGLPFRDRGGALYWPRTGNGTYWSVELRSARRLGATITCCAGWLFEPAGCACRQYEWIPDLYEKRRAIGKNRRGEPIKKALAALYGKHAQRIGQPPYGNPISGGLITAITRAAINDAIAIAGAENVVMIATDAIYTLGKEPAALDLGPGLGQWEAKRLPRLFIVRPGLYWPPRPRGKAGAEWKIKTKGISPKFFEPMISTFQRRWARYCRSGEERLRLSPEVKVKVELFVGLKYAYRSGHLDEACQWIERELFIRFGDRGEKGANKREGVVWAANGKSLMLGVKRGKASATSYHYERGPHESGDRRQVEAAWSSDWELDRDLLDDQPDVLIVGPPLGE